MAFAYATLQDGMEYFTTEHGYVAYVAVWHPAFALSTKRIVLGDPVCSDSDRLRLTDAFLDDCCGRAVFAVISEEFSALLRDRAFRVNCIGYEPELPLAEYNLDGNWRELDIIRRARNEIARAGVEIREVTVEKLDQAALNRVSTIWLSRKSLSRREIWVFARKPVFRTEPDVRKFAAFTSDGALVGFAFYDPMYESGHVIGYSANTVRCDETCYRKLSVAMNVTAGTVFKHEGKRILSLCIAPFDKVRQGVYNDDAALLAFALLLRRFGDRIYNFGGLSFYKSKYRAVERPVYFASRSVFPVNDLYLTFAASRIASSYFGVLARLAAGMLEEGWRMVKRRLGDETGH